MKNSKLIFYTNPMSRGRVVRWMLEEIGCPYETHLLEFATTMKAPEYLAVNPMGKVPAIKHGDAVVTETVAICTYLAQIFPEAGLMPKAGNHKDWADYYRWLFFVAGPLEAAVTDKSLSVEVPKDKQGFVGYGTLDKVLDALKTTLEHKDTIAGNYFTTADIIVSSYLSYYTTFGSIPTNPVFERYVKLHKSRPAAMKADTIDNDIIAKSKAG